MALIVVRQAVDSDLIDVQMVIHLSRKLDRLDAVIRWVARARLPTSYTLRIPVMARSVLHLLNAELLDVA